MPAAHCLAVMAAGVGLVQPFGCSVAHVFVQAGSPVEASMAELDLVERAAHAGPGFASQRVRHRVLPHLGLPQLAVAAYCQTQDCKSAPGSRQIGASKMHWYSRSHVPGMLRAGPEVEESQVGQAAADLAQTRVVQGGAGALGRFGRLVRWGGIGVVDLAGKDPCYGQWVDDLGVEDEMAVGTGGDRNHRCTCLLVEAKQ